MNIKMNKFKTTIGFLLMILAFSWVVYIQYTNIDMTEMRLSLTYWKSYLAIILITFVGYFLVSSKVK